MNHITSHQKHETCMGTMGTTMLKKNAAVISTKRYSLDTIIAMHLTLKTSKYFSICAAACCCISDRTRTGKNLVPLHQISLMFSKAFGAPLHCNTLGKLCSMDHCTCPVALTSKGAHFSPYDPPLANHYFLVWGQ